MQATYNHSYNHSYNHLITIVGPQSSGCQEAGAGGDPHGDGEPHRGGRGEEHSTADREKEVPDNGAGPGGTVSHCYHQ